jgi:hypothetical protein
MADHTGLFVTLVSRVHDSKLLWRLTRVPAFGHVTPHTDHRIFCFSLAVLLLLVKTTINNIYRDYRLHMLHEHLDTRPSRETHKTPEQLHVAT